MRLAGLCVCVAVGAAGAYAQPVVGAKSGVISKIDGQAWLDDKVVEEQPAVFPDVKENVTLRTDEGLVEVLLTPGVVLRLGEKSSFKMITNRLIDTRLDLLSGEAVVTALDLAKDTNVTFVVKDRTITLNKAGLYHFYVEPARLKVFAGSADVKSESDTVTVAAGKMMSLGSALAIAEKFDIKDTDSLDHWSRRRDELMARSNVSTANQQRTTLSAADPCYGAAGPRTPGIISHALGTWGYNPYYGLATYIPCNGSLWSPYGYQYWSPLAAYRAFYAPRPIYHPMPSGGGFGGYQGPATMGATSGGYSGVMAASGTSTVSAAPAAAASAGSSSAASAGSSSAGHATGGGGGRGH